MQHNTRVAVDDDGEKVVVKTEEACGGEGMIARRGGEGRRDATASNNTDREEVRLTSVRQTNGRLQEGEREGGGARSVGSLLRLDYRMGRIARVGRWG